MDTLLAGASAAVSDTRAEWRLAALAFGAAGLYSALLLVTGEAVSGASMPPHVGKMPELRRPFNPGEAVADGAEASGAQHGDDGLGDLNFAGAVCCPSSPN